MARLREFEIDEALDGVMGVFWRLGFDGASMQDIEAATGLNKQSLYRVFPDKRAMYLAALRRYEDQEMARAAEILAIEGTAKERFHRLFEGLIALAAKGDRKGCFLCNAAGEHGPEDAPAADFVAAAMRRMEKTFREALEASAPYTRDKTRRDEKAASLMASYFGIRVMTKANAPLRAVKAAASDAVEQI